MKLTIMSVTAHRPQLETVPETEILDSSASHEGTMPEYEADSCNSGAQASTDSKCLQLVAYLTFLVLHANWQEL